MPSILDQYNPDQLSPEELSAREKQLLQTHLDQEKIARWKKVAGPNPSGMQKYKWLLLVLAVFIGVGVCWQAGVFSDKPGAHHQTIASPSLFCRRFRHATTSSN